MKNTKQLQHAEVHTDFPQAHCKDQQEIDLSSTLRQCERRVPQ